MTADSKPKVTVYWAASCGGCDIENSIWNG